MATRRSISFLSRSLDACDRHPERELGIDGGRRLDSRRGGDGDDGVVEIVIVPEASDPGRVGGVGECGRWEPDEEGRDEQREDTTRDRHDT